MPISQNRYYNDPAIGAAFNNIAQMFAPPSGGDLAGYATAAAKKEEAARLAELFNYAKDPSVQQDVFDRLGQATGQWTPSTGYYGVNVAAQTSRSNNAADNARALQTNAADNARALQQAAMNNRSGAITSLFGALNPGQIAPAVPEDIAGLIGLPAIEQRAGAPKPLTDSELKATILGQLPADEQRVAALGSTPTTNVVTPEGPRVVFQADAIGQEPYFNKGAEAKPQNAVALMPDRRTRVPAIQGPDGKWVHAQTGQQLPEGIEIFDLPKAEGSAADVGFAPTVANTTQANNQEAEVTRALGLLDLYEASVRSNPGSIGLAGLIRGTAQNAAQTATDLAAAFGGTAPQVNELANEFRAGLQGVAPQLFDRSIPEQEFLQGTLAYSLARTENPSGEVSRQAYERALDRVRGGGWLANSASAQAAIDTNRKVLQSQLGAIRTLRAPGTGRTDTSFQTPAMAPAEAPAAPTGTVRRYNPATGRIE